MRPLDASTWAKSNVWRMPSGELCVRPGLRRIYTPSSRTIVAGFSVPRAETGSLAHYVFDIATSGRKDLKLRILDEDFQTFQIFSLNADVDPRGVGYGIVGTQIMISSPDFPTLWGIVGSGVRFASKVSSGSGSTALEVPRGVITSWLNRVVICNGRTMNISDPTTLSFGSPRSFIGDNQSLQPGAIYGVHQGAGGMLVLVTSEGTFGIDSSGGSVGIVSTGFRQLSHARASSYDSSCVVRGRVFALTPAGYMAVDAEGQPEQFLAEPYMPRAYGPRVSLQDFRSCRIFGADHGPIVANLEQNAAHFLDMDDGLGSWWRSSVTPTSFKVRGLLRDVDGSDLLLCENGVFRVDGDFDGETALSSGVSTQPKGFFFGSVPMSASQNHLPRQIFVDADVGAGGKVYAAVRGAPLPTSTGTAGVSDPEGITIGTDSWGTATKRYTTSSLQAIEFKSGETKTRATNDVTVEVGAEMCLTRLRPVVEVDPSESAPTRPAKVAS